MSQPPVWPAEVFTDISRDGATPLYQQIASRLEHAIATGRLKPGERLETELAIADHLRISRPTVRRAIQELVDKGLLVRRQGVGTQVVHRQVARAVELTSLNDDLERTGHQPSTRVLSCEEVPAPADIASLLGVDPGSLITRVHRVRFSDDAPLAVLTNYLPPWVGDLTVEALAEHGLYQLLASRGITVKVANQTIGARLCTVEEHELLDVPKHSAVLTMERIGYDGAGSAVEVGRHCYRADRYRFETTLVKRSV